MRTAAAILAAALVASPGIAANRHWQTGTCVDAGITRDPRVGAAASPLGSPYRSAITPDRSQIATYVLDVGDLRVDIQDIVPIGTNAVNLTIGERVTVALEKNVAYIRGARGEEHRFRIVKQRQRSPER